MDTSSMNSESQDSDEPAPPGTVAPFPIIDKKLLGAKLMAVSPLAAAPSPGMLNAKKKLRAFSIQKKATITPVKVPKPVSTGSNTVLIGKLSSVKVTPKPEPVDDAKKPPKPPRPGTSKRGYGQETYVELQKRNIEDIENMKRKMELIELGIPLGLICPTSTSETAMPTKAMPPIKSFLDPAKVDELIREGKKAKAEGRKFKFELHKFLPDYDNPFQRKRESQSESDKKADHESSKPKEHGDKRKSDRFDRRFDYRKDKYKEKRDKKDKDKRKEEKREDKKVEVKKMVNKETDLNLNDYLVCDSWSLDTDKTNSSSPKPVDKVPKRIPSDKVKSKEEYEKINETAESKGEIDKVAKEVLESPLAKPIKVEKLQPVMDSFKYELDSNEDEVLDIFDEETDLERFNKPTKEKNNDSPVKLFDYDQEPSTADDDNFLESVINEIKQEDMSDISQDKGLVEYDMSPPKEDVNIPRESVTPELDDIMRSQQRYTDGYKSSDSYKSRESGYKSDRSDSYKSQRSDSYKSGTYNSDPDYKERSEGYKSDRSESYKSDLRQERSESYNERGYKSDRSESYKSDRSESYKSDRSESYKSDSYRVSIEKELDDALGNSKMSKSTVDSLETWSFVLKICQPLLFRHDKNKCYKETHTEPKLWYTGNPRLCDCVKDRAIVYEELETCKTGLVDRVYGCDQIADAPCPKFQNWYPRLAACLSETSALQLSTEWETEEQESGQKTKGKEKRRSMTPQRREEILLDEEYQRFMEAVCEWPDVNEGKSETSKSTTPVREIKRKKADENPEEKKKAKKIKLSSEGWSQESEIEEEPEKPKKTKIDREKRKRKRSTSTLSSSMSDSDESSVKRKKIRKKTSKKTNSKSAKRRRINKKYLKKLKDKQRKEKKKKIKAERISDESELEEQKETKKEKKARKKKEIKLKKAQKKKKARAKSSSSSSSSSESSSSDTDSDDRRKRKRQEEKKRRKKKRKSSTESTQSDELFDVNILNNIKTERLTDDEKGLNFSPRKQKPREIINVKELQNDFVGNIIHIKQEVIEEPEKSVEREEEIQEEVIEPQIEEPNDKSEFKEPELPSLPPLPDGSPILPPEPIPVHEIPEPPPQIDRSTPQIPDESNNSQCSSQESICSIKEPSYEKDDSHLRPSSQNSNYSFNDVINASQGMFPKMDELEDKFENYEQGNYEMYEQLAMAYQSNVANQQIELPAGAPSRIETVVGARRRGEIKCDWRAGDETKRAQEPHRRPSRWGLKPGEVNIVLTGGGNERYNSVPVCAVQPVYQIESIANRTDTQSMSYDEAYMDMYGASDRLQYGDCFATPDAESAPDTAEEPATRRISSLDARIDKVLRDTGFSAVPKEDDDKDSRDKGILKPADTGRGAKRVSFADGYKPGQDSDVEEPPVKKKKKPRKSGCAWPCPASHPDHVPLWDALPPPPPPPGSPPPPPRRAPPPHLLRPRRRAADALPDPPHPPHPQLKFDPNSPLPPFMPPEPPPGMISFH